MVHGLGPQDIVVWNNEKDNALHGFSSSGFQNPMFVPDSCFTEEKGDELMGSNQQVLAALNLSEKFSPLGLKLRKTPSFLELLDMKLSEATEVRCENLNSQPISENLKASNFSISQPNREKLKASNISASYIQIGSWQQASRYEGDLVAKVYYAKRKLVWEILNSGLKSKIELEWSHISAIRATFGENIPDVLEIELNHAPMFSRETTPQPRKHTLWQATSDFTGGQASKYRRHYLQFPKGTLEKHYEKLMQCDNRLYALSQRPFPFHRSPYIPSSCNEYLDYSGPEFSSLFGHALPDSYLSQFPHIGITSSIVTQQFPKFETLESTIAAIDSTLPYSVMDFPPIEENNTFAHFGNPKTLFLDEGFKNQKSIGNAGGYQIQELCSIDQKTPFLHQHISSTPLLSDRSWDNLTVDEFMKQGINVPPMAVCSDENKIMKNVSSMHSVLGTPSQPDFRVKNISREYDQYGQMSINNSFILRRSQHSDEYNQYLGPKSKILTPEDTFLTHQLLDEYNQYPGPKLKILTHEDTFLTHQHSDEYSQYPLGPKSKILMPEDTLLTPRMPSLHNKFSR
ncbi:uncharacterized protein LOC143852919 [Tasmannia lanceolata]|uniref:uncharacterized protein LOC143852919 n=1 Tax=Tasmannia lanceolata TaxID=3420 RepID=UPI0040640029